MCEWVCVSGYRVAICAPWVAFLHSVNFDLAKCCAQLPLCNRDATRVHRAVSAPPDNSQANTSRLLLTHAYFANTRIHTLTVELPPWTESGWRWQVLRCARKKIKNLKITKKYFSQSGKKWVQLPSQASGWVVDVDVHVEVNVYYVSFSSQQTVSFVLKTYDIILADMTRQTLLCQLEHLQLTTTRSDLTIDICIPKSYHYKKREGPCRFLYPPIVPILFIYNSAELNGIVIFLILFFSLINTDRLFLKWEQY